MTQDLETHPLYFMGRKIGTYDSVDIYPETGLKFYNYNPDAKCTIPAGTIFIDLGRGTVIVEGADPETTTDVITAIQSCDKVSAEEWDAEEARLDEDEG
jgi:hypothetical protein